MEIAARSHSSHSLHSRFSDESHLVFYGCSSSTQFKPLGTHLHTAIASSSSLPLTAVLPAHPLPSQPSSCATVSCNTVSLTPSEPDLFQELAVLKAQVKLKKKQLKSVAKERKAALKGKKSKAKCESSTSSSSESCDEGNMSINTRLLKNGSSSIRDDEGSRQGVSGMGELHRLHSDVDLADALPQSRFQSSTSCTPSGIILNGFIFKACAQQSLDYPVQDYREDAEHAACSATIAVPSHETPVSTGSIEVCVGGKCKKAGSQQLLSSFQMQIPASASVEAMPCKCMGKCSSAINVRVQKEDTNPQHHSHVGVHDAGLILRHHFGLGPPPSGLPYFPNICPATPAIHTANV